MLYFGLGMGALLFLIGILTYYLAPRVGPNPIFGVRIGYSYASREVWDKTNRFGGMLIALVGLGLALCTLVLQLLGLANPNGILVLTVLLTLALLGATAWMFVYARGLAQGTAITREIAPVPFRWVYVAPVLLTFALLVAVAAYLYPQVPAARMASHFNIHEQPDGWMPRDAFFVTYLGSVALFVALDVLVVLGATREPLIAFRRLGSNWRMDPAQGLIYMGLALALVNVLFIVLLIDVVAFSTRGAFLFPLSILLWISPLLIIILVAMFFLLGRREPAAAS